MMSNREGVRDNLTFPSPAYYCGLYLEVFRLDIDLFTDQFPVVIAFPAYLLFDKMLFGTGIAPGIYSGGAAYYFDTPNQVCETASRTGVHVTGEQVTGFGIRRENPLGIAKSRAVPGFMTMPANESGELLKGFAPMENGVGQRIFVHMPIFEKLVTGADFLDKGHIGVFVLEILPGYFMPHKTLQHDFKVWVAGSDA